MNDNELIERLNEIEFVGLEGVACGDACHFLVKNARCDILHAIVRIFKIAVLKRYEYKKNGKGNILFLFSRSYFERRDFEPWFKKVYKETKESIIIRPVLSKKVDLINIKHLKYIFKWSQQLKQKHVSLIDRFNCFCWIYAIKSDLEQVKKIVEAENVELKLVVVLCDSHAIDSVLVQYYNRINIPTATLQHGLMSSKLNSWAVKGSKSRYYLAYGPFSENQCIKAGIENVRIVQVGVPKYIGVDFKQMIQGTNKECFGVVLDGSIYRDSDIDMLAMCDAYARQHNKKYMVKLHPGDTLDSYAKALESEYIEEVFCTEISSEEFSERICFAVVSKSTVCLEYVINLLPVVIYLDTRNRDIYEGIDWCKFTSLEQMNQIISRMECEQEWLESKLKETRLNFCRGEDIGKNYREFFDKFLQ